MGQKGDRVPGLQDPCRGGTWRVLDRKSGERGPGTAGVCGFLHGTGKFWDHVSGLVVPLLRSLRLRTTGDGNGKEGRGGEEKGRANSLQLW